ncbi:aldolase [Planosporangium thailandense]|uniref:Aldolase n=1 Tax=Planosporangium thailandense TaxID=765197 RepID=A0ABX0Y4X5_9ACTN|nr:aldolase/citrate lyase family protein [Planosporangium thailandense]NJC73083.1 aldolase [Planosporangium thailandense]
MAIDSGRLVLDEALFGELDVRLAETDTRLARDYPGDPGTRQPVHTVYVPADRFRGGTVADWGRTALALLDEHAPDAAALAAATGIDPAVVAQVFDRVRAKLATEPIEDLRVDFEDGYGWRGDGTEDAAALATADALADRPGAPFFGIRFKCLERASRRRGLRTLDLVLARLLDRRGADGLPPGFVVTLPKVTAVEQVEAMVTVCRWLEDAHGLPDGRLRFEIQVETPQSILASDGTAAVARMVHAAAGRCAGLHYGTYDYSASVGVAAAYQSMDHPAADHAKAVMQVAAAGTGVRCSDGSTNVLPVGGTAEVHAAWRLHARLVRRSLERGFYQGWDLHPGHLPTRFLATYAFFRAGFGAAAARLAAYTRRAESGVLDEPATALALAGFLTRGLDCGALDEPEVRAATGLDRTALEEVARRRSGVGGGS